MMAYRRTIRNKQKKSEIIVKKYPILAIFKATRCDLVISKEKEKRLKQIIKEINNLREEMELLFKK